MMTSPIAQALGWALLHFLWEGTAIALVLAIALWFCRASRVRYALASAAMASMVLAFAVTMAVCWPADSHVGSLTARGPLAPIRLAPAPDGNGAAIDGLRESAPPAWFVPVWLSGVSIFYLYSLAAWLAANRLKRRGAFAAPLEWQERLQQLGGSLGLRRTVALLESCLTDVPVVIGYLRPVILLPLGVLAALTPEQVEAILIHELAHIRRYDYLVNVIQTMVEGLLFYHPAVWWVGSLMRGEREHSCDDIVVAQQGDAQGYAATLARLELSRGTAREPALAATGGNLMRRIHRILQQPEGPRVAAPLISAAVLLATATLAMAAWQAQPQTQQQQTPPQPAQHIVEPLPQRLVEPMPQTATPLTPRPQRARELETPYIKWMNEDVAYIITDAERAAFKSLPTDAEREKFIEQFWLRRDPTPGTVANEFKEQHYRRIAYANEHYAAGVPGWKTDRGRIYITYGPPDEIEDHPATAATVPSQAWRYKFIEGVGTNVIIEFIDPTLTGEYRMTMDPAEKNASPPLTIHVNVSPDPNQHSRTVSLSVPLDSQGHPTLVQGLITTLGGRNVASFTDDLNGHRGSYEKVTALVPGSYRAILTVKDQVTGEFHRGTLDFQVQ